MSINKFVSPGFFLSVDLILVSLVNWIFWLIISSITYPSEVGIATSVYSFVVLISAITMLGFEYSLVKKSSSLRSHVLGTSIIIELLLTLISIPLILYFVNDLYNGSLSSLAILAVGLLIFYSQRNIMRFTLLGKSDATSVLRINLIGVVLQLVTGTVLVYLGFGAFGILMSFLLHFILVTTLSFIVARRSFELNLRDFRFAKEILKDALMNTPNSLSKTVIYTLSVVLLASIGIDQAEVGKYYIALMVSVIVGGFAGNIAFMVIPASSLSKADYSLDSTRLGLSSTSPLIVALMVAPVYVLSIVGSEYASAGPVLFVLAIAIFPYVILINAISKFNNMGSSKKIISLGTIQLLTFLLVFFILTPNYGTLGSALSILIASIAAAIPSLIWSDHLLSKYAVKAIVSIVAGLAIGYLIPLISDTINQAIPFVSAIAVTLSMVFILKITSTNEISIIVSGLVRRESHES